MRYRPESVQGLGASQSSALVGQAGMMFARIKSRRAMREIRLQAYLSPNEHCSGCAWSVHIKRRGHTVWAGVRLAQDKLLHVGVWGSYDPHMREQAAQARVFNDAALELDCELLEQGQLSWVCLIAPAHRARLREAATGICVMRPRLLLLQRQTLSKGSLSTKQVASGRQTSQASYLSIFASTHPACTRFWAGRSQRC